MDTSQYILSFNFQEFTSQVESVTRSYTDLGATIRSVAQGAGEDVDALQEKVSSVTSALGSLSSTLDLTFLSLQRSMQDTSDILETIEKQSKEISSNFGNLGQALGGLTSSPAPETAGERIQDVAPGGISGVAVIDGGAGGEGSEALEALKQEADSAVEHAKQQIENLEKAKEGISKEMNVVARTVVKEGKSLKSGVGSLVSRASMGVLGAGLMGGALTAMILGVSENYRKQAESGEVINVLEATGERIYSAPVRKAKNWFSAFQEKAQYHYGIGRKEVQGIMKQMVDAGFKSTDMLDRFSKKLGKVGSNVVTLTLGLDKHLNLATGSSMQNTIEVTQQYGTSLQGAARGMMDLNLSAQQSGAGMNKFIDSVMSGGSALAQYGIDLREVVAMTSKLEKHYRDMGLGKQYAGALGTQAATGIAQGLSNLPDAMKALVGKEMGYGEGFEAIQGFEEGWQSVLSGRSATKFGESMSALGNIVDRHIGHGGRAAQIAFLKSSQGGNMGSLAATTFIDMKNAGELEDLTDNSKESNRNLEKLKQAFLTEGQQVSELQKDQRDIIDGMAGVGRGILQMVGGLIGVMVVGIRSLPALVRWLYEKTLGDDKKADRIMDSLTRVQDEQFTAISSGFDTFSDAASKLGDTALAKVFKHLGSNVQSAANADFSGMNDADLLRRDVMDMKFTLADLTSNLKDALESTQEHREDALDTSLPIGERLAARTRSNTAWKRANKLSDQRKRAVDVLKRADGFSQEQKDWEMMQPEMAQIRIVNAVIMKANAIGKEMSQHRTMTGR